MVLSIQHPPNIRTRKFRSSDNRLLSLLSESDRQNLIINSDLVFLAPKKMLHRPDEPIEKVYFPIRGIMSLINITAEGSIAETAAVGNEGMVGIAAFLGGIYSPYFTVAQNNCVAISLAANLLQQEFTRGGELQKILLLYTQALFAQVSQNVLCSSQHSLEQRLARWLLTYSNRLRKRELLITQETLANMLGVRRSSLSVVANELRRKDLIEYSRGRIIIKNSIALRNVACECNEVIAAEYYRLLNISLR